MYKMTVLIDTWWNVNSDNSSDAVLAGRVLIDTWWNVNSVADEFCNMAGMGFNRYMVECES